MRVFKEMYWVRGLKLSFQKIFPRVFSEKKNIESFQEKILEYSEKVFFSFSFRKCYRFSFSYKF